MTVRCGPRRSIAGKQAGIVGDGKGRAWLGADQGPFLGAGSPPPVRPPGLCQGRWKILARVWEAVWSRGGFGGRGEMEVNPGSAALSLEPPCDSASVSYSCQMR